ncbi:MAG: three-Cys-motif partner protein TcmP [Candidatus Thermoplasmatota archaeon]|nr:three-Cys-motif partner protein TcmP [Candidatus Thermoplasmatota archaeon]
MQPHTEAKHAILKSYLGAWFPILSRAKTKRILYIDAFAGPGRYKGDEQGSPIIALEVARDHILNLPCEIVFWFIESRSDRYDNLVSEIGQIQHTLPKNLKILHECCEFDESVTRALDGIENSEKALAPALVFIDPFGFSDTPMSTIQRIMSNKKSEVLITFMTRDIDRFKSRPELASTFDRLFGTDEWSKAFDMHNQSGRIDFLRELYRTQLEKVAGVKYARAFDMLDQNDSPIYSLFHGTNSVKGLLEMKTAFWKIDETGSYRFSDRTIKGQSRLFGSDLAPLKTVLTTQLNNGMHLIDELDRFVVVETPYLPKHLNCVLRELEGSNPPGIKVECTGSRRRHCYPRQKASGLKTRIQFI